MYKYETAKKIEGRAIKFLVDKMDKSFKQMVVGQYSVADLIVKKNSKYFCAEVKSRTYGLEFFEKYGVAVEDYKLQKIKQIYHSNKLVLITITSEGYILRSVIDDNTEIQYKVCSKTTSFDNQNKVEKKFRVSKDFQVIGKLD